MTGYGETPEDLLEDARQTMLGMLPENIQEAFGSVYAQETMADYYKWRGLVIERLMALARPAKPPLGETDTENCRVSCPLCRGGGSGQGLGYLYPEGLRRHLSGCHNVWECRVVAHITGGVRAHIREAERRAKLEQLRAKSEMEMKRLGAQRREAAVRRKARREAAAAGDRRLDNTSDVPPNLEGREVGSSD